MHRAKEFSPLRRRLRPEDLDAELPSPQRRRLRGKHSWAETPTAANHLRRLLELGGCLVSEWLGQRELCRLAAADTTGRETAAQPETWHGRCLDLRSRCLRGSMQLQELMRTARGRWCSVQHLVLPQCQPSAAAASALRTALPQLQGADLGLCPRAGGLRLLAELGGCLDSVLLPGYLPQMPLPRLRVLKLTGPNVELHLQGRPSWVQLPEVAPRLESFSATWDDGDSQEGLSLDAWEKLHEPPLGCMTTDVCLEELQRLTELQELDLSGVYTITDAGLASLGSMASLRRLELRNMGYGVSDAGLRALAEGCAPLSHLDLRQCLDTGKRPNSGRTAITPEGVQHFRRKRPAATVLLS